MTTARSSTKDTLNATPVRQVRERFGLIYFWIPSSDGTEKTLAGLFRIGRVKEEGDNHDYEANHRRPA